MMKPVRDGAQREGAHDGVKTIVGELQRLRVAEAQAHASVEVCGAVAGQVEHGGAPLDAGQPNRVGVVGEVEPGADGHFQDLAGGLGADPLPAVAEQVPVEETHLLVVGAGVLVPVAAQPLVLVG
jgi:hypothetical protein